MDQDKPIIIDDKKFALYGKPVEGGRGAPKMQFGVFRGNPNVVVFTNDPSDPEKKPIRAAMDPVIWGGFIELIKMAADADPNWQRRIPNRKGPPQKTFVESVTIVGKDAEGVVYIAINKQGRPTKKIPILPGMYADLTDDQGNPIPDGEKSVVFAKGFAITLNHIMLDLMRETYEPAQPPGGQQGGGGGYNRGGGGGGGYQQQRGGQPSGGGGAPQGGGGAPQGGGSFEDDLPM
jgi:hypothetical protein